MTSVSGLEVSIFRIPLDAQGKQLVSQQCGYFHLWRFLNSDGSISLDGEIGATFGGQWDNEAIPFGYNSRLALAVPVDRVLIEWAAQPGRVAEILMTRDPRGLDGQNTPARQLVFQGQARTASARAASVISASSSQILAPDSTRSKATIKALTTNTDRIFLGQTPLNSGNGIPLEPGESISLALSGSIRALAASGTQEMRILEEFF